MYSRKLHGNFNYIIQRRTLMISDKRGVTRFNEEIFNASLNILNATIEIITI